MANTLNFLTAWGCSMDDQNEEGSTPLHLAVMNGNFKIVRRLVLKKANKKIRV